MYRTDLCHRGIIPFNCPTYPLGKVELNCCASKGNILTGIELIFELGCVGLRIIVGLNCNPALDLHLDCLLTGGFRVYFKTDLDKAVRVLNIVPRRI
jgi:hypothetical protein